MRRRRSATWARRSSGATTSTWGPRARTSTAIASTERSRHVAVTHPVGGWSGLKKGLRGRFGTYVPPVLEALGLAEVEHNAKNNRMRAK